MREIFIEEWKIQDHAGRRDKSIVSDGTINGEHVFACQSLTSWFRLGKYIIKHDTANYLLGLTRQMRNHECKNNVKWWDSKTLKDENCVDEIVKVVNKHFKKDGYVEALLVLQEAIKGYEKCIVISKFHNLPFDYNSFLSDRDAYQKRLEAINSMIPYKQFIKK
jgi:hypothetical protein